MPGSTGGGWKRSDLATVTGVAQPTGKPAEDRPQALPSGTATAPALDPTILCEHAGAGSRSTLGRRRLGLLRGAPGGPPVAVNAGCSEEAFPRLAQTDAVPGQPGEAPREQP